MNCLADEIALLCYRHYEEVLLKKGKPKNDGEWTIMAAIIMEDASGDKLSRQVVSMGTGSKCIGKGKMSLTGDILHDSHAEVMARRGFIRYLYEHIRKVYSGAEDELFILNPESRKCSCKQGLSFLFFSTHTPCGDASIIPKNSDSSSELQPTDETLTCGNINDEPPRKQAKYDESQEDIHRTGAKCVNGGPQDPKLPGKEHHITGVLRTKPGRGDRTLSMSCSDKLAKWNIVGVQGALIMNFLSSPLRFSHIIIGKCPYDEVAFKRAMVDRFQPRLLEYNIPPYTYNAASVAQSQYEFKYSKQSVTASAGSTQPCPSSIVWYCCSTRQCEVAVEGKKQGATKKTQSKPSARLDICRKNLFQQFASILKEVPPENLPPHLKKCLPTLDSMTYHEAKELASEYQFAWNQLRDQVMPTWIKKSLQFVQFTALD